jgi:hypothetical protein
LNLKKIVPISRNHKAQKFAEPNSNQTREPPIPKNKFEMSNPVLELLVKKKPTFNLSGVYRCKPYS